MRKPNQGSFCQRTNSLGRTVNYLEQISLHLLACRFGRGQYSRHSGHFLQNFCMFVFYNKCPKGMNTYVFLFPIPTPVLNLICPTISNPPFFTLGYCRHESRISVPRSMLAARRAVRSVRVSVASAPVCPCLHSHTHWRSVCRGAAVLRGTGGVSRPP